MFPRFISVKTHCFHQKILSLHYQIKYSPITSNLFTRPLIHLSTCHVILSQTYLVPVSALCYSPNLFICYLVSYYKQLVHLSTHPPVNLPRYPISNIPCPCLSPLLLPELVHLLPCLLFQATCSPVNLSTCQLALLLPELVHLLPCLLSHTTC